MVQTLQAPPPVRAGVARKRSRLRTLKGQALMLAGLILLLSALLAFAGATTLSRAANDMHEIDSESIPSVDAAQSVTHVIDVIDAQAADFLAAAGLTRKVPCTVAGLETASSLVITVHECDERNIDAEIVLVNQQIYAAAHNVTYPGERTAVERIMIGLESYLGDIHQMRLDYALAASKTDKNDPSLLQAYHAYLDASAILHTQVRLTTLGSERIPFERETDLPSCILPGGQTLAPEQWTQGGLVDALGCLSSINYQHLQGAYSDSRSFLDRTTGLLAMVCVLFCGLLLLTTVRLVLSTHRLLHPGLLAAVLPGLILSVSVVSLLGSLSGQGSQASRDGAFRQLVVDDYASVYAAALLTHYGADANADESRWLIAHEFADQASIQRWQADWDANVREIETLMQQAHANQTWVEELRPLTEMDASWRQYDGLDAQIRSRATQQNDPERLLTAESLSTGPSSRAFSAFLAAVNQLGQANHEQYLLTLDAVQGALVRDTWFSLLLFPLAGLLALGGIALRLQDF